MFTGIVEKIGAVADKKDRSTFFTLTITHDFSVDSIRTGDSVAVDGVCLTAVSVLQTSFCADVSPETVKKTTMHSLKRGKKVNLERAVTPATRMGGHLVSGHIDGVGTIVKKQSVGEGVVIHIKADKKVLHYLIVNGSVCVDGISLTVVDVYDDSFKLMIVPHTLRLTTLPQKKEGDPVNLETDMIGKYVENFLLQQEDTNKKSTITEAFLAQHGFM